jgi:GntR family transcriptional regulator
MTAGTAGRDHPIPVPSAAPLSPASARAGVLADRMAAALVHREPGWRLPRRSALARRYNVSLTEVDAALTDLARRSLVRRLPDGQLYRASPADYWIPVEGAGGLATRLDPMGTAITCQTRHVSRREAPQDVAWALGLPTGAPIRVVRCVWSAAGDPAAVSTAYLHEAAGEEDPEADPEANAEPSSFDSVLSDLPAAAVSVEMSPPQPAVARSLRLSPGQPVITVTVRFDDSTGKPAGLTVVMLKPELFRVAIDTTEATVSAPSLAVSVSKGSLPGHASSHLQPWIKMSARVATPAEQMPRRARYLVPKGLPRRGEILAACVMVAVLGHVLFAQLTLVLAVVFALTTRATRWRLSWLIVPVIIGVGWTLAVGPRAAAAGFADGPAKVASYLGVRGYQLDHALHFTGAFTGIGSWLPRQLPLALLTGAAEAAIIGWLSWLHTDEVNMPEARPGLLVAARRAVTRRAIRLGGVVTRDGSCLGVAPGSGARITLAWSETVGGVSVCGSAEQDVLGTSFQLVHAAVRRRKPVFVVDRTANPGLPGRLAAVCAAAGVPLRVFGDLPVMSRAGDPAGAWIRPACYEPFRHGDPGQRTSLIAAMVSWDGPGSQYRRSCVAYLRDVFELIDAAPGDPRVPILDEVIHLLNPTAMRARMEHVPATYPRRDALAERTRVSMSLLHAEPATTAALTRQLRELRESAFGRWLRPSGRDQGTGIDLGRTVSDRGAVLFRLGGTPQADAAAMVTRLVCQDLLTAGAALHGIGVDGDGIVWLAECGSMPRGSVTELIARGPAAGLPVLAATTSPPAAAELAELTNVVVAHRMEDQAAPHSLDGLPALRAGEFLLTVKNPRRLVPRAVFVRARVPAPGRDGAPAGADA